MTRPAALALALLALAGCATPAPDMPTHPAGTVGDDPVLATLPDFHVPPLGDASWAEYAIVQGGVKTGSVRFTLRPASVVDAFGVPHDGFVARMEVLEGDGTQAPWTSSIGRPQEAAFTRCGQPVWWSEHWGIDEVRTAYIFPGDEDHPADISGYSYWLPWPAPHLSGAVVPGAAARASGTPLPALRDWGWGGDGAVHLGDSTVRYESWANGTFERIASPPEAAQGRESWTATYAGEGFPESVARTHQTVYVMRRTQQQLAGAPLTACQHMPVTDAFQDDAVPIDRLGPTESPPFPIPLRDVVEAIAAGNAAPKVHDFLEAHPEAFLYSWEGLADGVGGPLAVAGAVPEWRLQFGAPGLDLVGVAFCRERPTATDLLGAYDCGEGSVSDVDHRYGAPPPRAAPAWKSFTTMPAAQQEELFLRLEGDICFLKGTLLDVGGEPPMYHLEASACGSYQGPRLDASEGRLLDGPGTLG